MHAAECSLRMRDFKEAQLLVSEVAQMLLLDLSRVRFWSPFILASAWSSVRGMTVSSVVLLLDQSWALAIRMLICFQV